MVLKILSEKDIQNIKKEKPFLYRRSDETKMDCVKRNLKKNGYVSRNAALRNYETKLSSHISDLKKQDWEIESIMLKGATVKSTNSGDMVYVLVKAGKN